MKLNALFSFILCCSLAINAYSQQKNLSPLKYLERIPEPAIDHEKAIDRCPSENDTLMLPVLKELSSLCEHDTAEIDVAINKYRGLQLKYLENLRQGLEHDIQFAGEQIDVAIQQCPTITDSLGRQVYDPQCVAVAEQNGRRRRVAAVEDYLTRIHELWPGYKRETLQLVSGSTHGKWQVLLRFAFDAAMITQTAAQFSR